MALQGPDLEEIATELLGFNAIDGETKLKLLPTPWPEDSLPSPTASLFAVASRKGLVAAAGPDVLVVTTTESVRQGFKADVAADNRVKSFTPQLSIPVPRLSHVAFSADETFLVICASEGGGLAVYDTQALLQGNTEPSSQVGTNGVSIRTLVPNPNPEYDGFVAVVLSSGQLMLADLVEKKLVDTPNGQVLSEGVSCVSWSTKGKQLVAGLGNGTAQQMLPTGSVKAEIPLPPGLDGDHHVSAISWLANDDFLVVYGPTANNSVRDPSIHMVQREKGSSNFTFRKLNDPCFPDPNGPRTPPHYFIARLKAFPPNLDDLLILATTASVDVGMITKSSAPLTSEIASDVITNVYTTTNSAIDARRAAAPMSSLTGQDTTAIGLAIDLSSKENVLSPILGDEQAESESPLPGLMLLNYEGVLCYWWVVYNDSVRQNTPYPELVAVSGQKPQEPTSIGGIGQGNALGGMGKPSTPSFGQAAFGAPGGSSFGGPTSLGGSKSPWAAQPGSASAQTGGAAFGQPAFGSSTALGGNKGSVFGSATGIGSKSSPWATAATSNQQQGGDAKPSNVFATPAAPASSPFAGLAGNSQSTASPFSNFGATNSGVSPFASTGQQTKSVFGAPTTNAPGQSFGMSTEPSFGSTVTIGSTLDGGSTVGSNQKSLWGTPTQMTFNKGTADAAEPGAGATEMADADDSLHAQGQTPRTEKPSGPFGLGSSGFKLGSTFQPDQTAKDQDGPPPAHPTGGSFFGTAFGTALGEAKPTASTTPVKGEPGTEEPKLADIPAAPRQPATLQEQPTAPVEPAKPDETAPSSAEPEAEPAPLPPSPHTSRPESKPAPSPPSSPASEVDSPEAEPEPAPLPPSPKFVTPAKPPPKETSSEHDGPLAGSPPVQIEGPQPSDVSSRTDEVDEEDAPLPLDPAPLPPDPTPFKPTPAWSFDQAPPQQSPKAPSSSAKSPQPFSHTPVGFPKGPALFPTSFTPQESPRSPSPVRSSSAPGNRPLSVQPSKPVSRSVAYPQPEPDPDFEQIDLQDEQADRIQEELATELVGSKDLPPFIAHQDYAGVPKPGLAGQIEAVYRDINSMIDTLGLNARSIGAFVKGHSEFYKEAGRQREDLAEDDDGDDGWCLVELPELAAVEDDIEHALDEGRVTGAERKTDDARALGRDVRRLRTRVVELRKQIETRQNPATAEAARTAPLSAGQTAQRTRLRDEFSRLQTQLAKLEEEITVLRVKLAASGAPGSPQTSGGGARNGGTPTVEAVQNTILKMTAMIERKSGDIDVLENQMRRLRFGSPSSDRGGSVLGRGSRENSPYATPPPRGGRRGESATPGPTPLREGSFGFQYGDEDAELAEATAGLALGSSLGGGGPGTMDEARRWMEVTVEEVKRYNENSARRKKVAAKLRETLLRRGPRSG